MTKWVLLRQMEMTRLIWSKEKWKMFESMIFFFIFLCSYFMSPQLKWTHFSQIEIKLKITAYISVDVRYTKYFSKVSTIKGLAVSSLITWVESRFQERNKRILSEGKSRRLRMSPTQWFKPSSIIKLDFKPPTPPNWIPLPMPHSKYSLLLHPQYHNW